MTNLWPEGFTENQKPLAKTLLEEQAKLLPKLTGDVVYAEVDEVSGIDLIGTNLNDDFVYRFDIRGKFLESYRFNVLMFSHDITLYPVKFRLDEQIAKELGVARNMYGFYTTVDTPEQLEEFTRQVLQSERVKSVVGSLMRLSK